MFYQRDIPKNYKHCTLYRSKVVGKIKVYRQIDRQTLYNILTVQSSGIKTAYFTFFIKFYHTWILMFACSSQASISKIKSNLQYSANESIQTDITYIWTIVASRCIDPPVLQQVLSVVKIQHITFYFITTNVFNSCGNLHHNVD